MNKQNKLTNHVIIFTSLLIIISCDSTKYNAWGLEWEFLNKIDSTAVNESIKYSIITEPAPKGYEIIEDTINSDGSLSEWILFPGDREEFLAPNPQLQFNLFQNTYVIFDTVFYWSELELVDRTNYQTFYIELLDTSINIQTISKYDKIPNHSLHRTAIPPLAVCQVLRCGSVNE